MKKVLQRSLAILLGCALSAPALLADIDPKDYKVIIEGEEGMFPWMVIVGAAPGSEESIWVDLNNNGRKDNADEGWDASRVDPQDGLCYFSAPKQSDVIVVHGPATVLICSTNNIVSLNVSNNPALTKLAANDNNIGFIDLSANTNLEVINLNKNQLSKIDLAGLTKLVDLRVGGNKRIAKLDLTSIQHLHTLDVSETNIKNLAGANLGQIKSLNITSAPVLEIDLKQMPLLEVLSAGECNLGVLDLSFNPKLTSLWAPYNQISRLDISKNLELTQVMLSYNKMERVDLSKHTKLKYIYLENNVLNEVILPSTDSHIKLLNCSANKTLSNLDVRAQGALEVLQLDATGLSSLDVSHNTGLRELTISETEISSIYLTNNSLLETLNISGARFSSIDLSQNTALKGLYCGKNQLSSLDLTACRGLEVFRGEHNKLTEIKLASLNLRDVRCYGNQIKRVAMGRLVESFPEVKGSKEGRFIVVDLSVEGEGNECLVSHVDLVKAKNWTVWNYNAANKQEIPYEGLEKTDSQTIEFEQDKLLLYPTTTATTFTLVGAQGKRYTIYSLQGEQVAKGLSSEAMHTVSVEDLPEGTYLISIEGAAQTHRIRVVR